MTMTNDEIRETLKKRQLKVIKHIERVKHHQTRYGRGRTYENYYIVIWADKNKIKYGHINANYTHRYGIDVLATYNGKRFWFKSQDIADSIPDSHLDRMTTLSEGCVPMELRDRTFQPLKELDVDSLEVSW